MTGVKVEAVEVLVELIYKGICNLEQVFQYSMENIASGVFYNNNIFECQLTGAIKRCEDSGCSAGLQGKG